MGLITPACKCELTRPGPALGGADLVAPVTVRVSNNPGQVRIELQSGLDFASAPAASRISHLPLFACKAAKIKDTSRFAVRSAALTCEGPTRVTSPKGRRLQVFARAILA